MDANHQIDILKEAFADAGDHLLPAAPPPLERQQGLPPILELRVPPSLRWSISSGDATTTTVDSSPLSLNISAGSIRASLGEVLVLQDVESSPRRLIQKVTLTRIPSRQTVLNEDLFFRKLSLFPALTELVLQFSNNPTVSIDCQILASTLSACPTLKHLTLYHYLGGKAHFLGLAIQRHPNLKEFYAKQIRSTNDDFRWNELWCGIGRSPSIRSVSIFPPLQYQSNHLLGASLPAICKSTSIQKLSLSCHAESVIPHLPLTFQTLQRHNSTLRSLSVYLPKKLSEADSTVHSLGLILQTNKTLQKLKIGVGEIETSLVPVLEALKLYNRTLQTLSVHYNHTPPLAPWSACAWPDRVVRNIREMLETNTTLQRIYGGQHAKNINRREKSLIEFYLKLNKLGRHRLLQQEQEEEEGTTTTTPSQQEQQEQVWVDFVLKNRHRVPILFYVLSLNPSLLQRCCNDDSNNHHHHHHHHEASRRSSVGTNTAASNSNTTTATTSSSSKSGEELLKVAGPPNKKQKVAP